MKRFILNPFTLIVLAVFLTTNIALSQDTPNEPPPLEKVTITLKSGNKFTGEILQQYPDSVLINVQNIGELTILHTDIKKVVFIQASDEDADVDIESGINPSWFKNPSPNYFLIGGNAINHKKGQWVYQNGMLSYNAFSYGFTDNISMKISSFIGVDENVIIHPKVTFPISDIFHVGFGNAFVITGNGWGSLLQATTTLGNKDRNLSLALGFAYVNGEGFFPIPVISINGVYRFSEKVAFMTENWLLRSSDFNAFELGVYTYGFRIYLKNLSFDFMLANNRELMNIIAIGVPVISISVPFGKR